MEQVHFVALRAKQHREKRINIRDKNRHVFHYDLQFLIAGVLSAARTEKQMLRYHSLFLARFFFTMMAEKATRENKRCRFRAYLVSTNNK